MSQLALARRAVSDRRNDVSKCMAELKAAQASAADENVVTSKLLTVTVKEVYGTISVDRVAVRSVGALQQEKVVVEGIPCSFELDKGVSDFDLVLMAEHATASGDGVAKAAETATAVAQNLSSGPASAAVAAVTPAEGEEGAQPEAPEGSSAAAATSDGDKASAGSGAVEGDAVGHVETQEGPEGDEVVVGATAAEASKSDAVDDTVEEASSAVAEKEPKAKAGGDAEPDNQADIAPASETPTLPKAAEAAAAIEEGTANDETETVAPPAAVSVDDVDLVKDGEAEQAASASEEGASAAESEAKAGADVLASATVEKTAAAAEVEKSAAPAAPIGGNEEAVTQEAAQFDDATLNNMVDSIAAQCVVPPSALGCSTVTTEVVVPSSELDFESADGQWRYLEAGATPGDGEDTSPVEVSKGVRFSATLESHGGENAESRILDLSIKHDGAEMRLRTAEAALEKIQPKPAPSSSSDRKLTGASGTGRKSAMKKTGRRKQDGARSTSGGAQKGKGGGEGFLSAKTRQVYAYVKPVGAFGWRCRNFLMFVTAVYAIHKEGDFLSV